MYSMCNSMYVKGYFYINIQHTQTRKINNAFNNCLSISKLDFPLKGTC